MITLGSNNTQGLFEKASMDKHTSITSCIGNDTRIFFSVLAMYAIANFALYFNDALIPDEIWFIETALTKASDWPVLENYFGYGAPYWYIHDALANDFEYGALTLRFVYWLFLVSGVIAIWTVRERYHGKFLFGALLFYLSLPFAWWQGKITGPEPLAHFFVILSFLSITYFKFRPITIALSGFFCGLATAVKLSTAPVSFAILGLLMSQRSPDLRLNTLIQEKRNIIVFFATLILTFLISNPTLLLDSKRFINNLPHDRGINLIDRAFDMFLRDDWLWEAVPSGGLVQFGLSLSIGILLFIFLFLAKPPKPMILGFAIMFLSTMILILLAPSYWGWYWYSAVMLLPFLIASSQNYDNRASAALVVLLVVSLVSNFPLIREMINLKVQHIVNLNNIDAIAADVDRIIVDTKPDLVVDFGDFNLNWYNKLRMNLNEKNKISWIANLERRKFEGLNFIWNHYLTWVRNKSGKVVSCPKIDDFQTVLLVIGDRVKQHIPGWSVDLKQWVQSSFVKECPGWTLSQYRQFNQINYFILTNQLEHTSNVARIFRKEEM